MNKLFNLLNFIVVFCFAFVQSCFAACRDDVIPSSPSDRFTVHSNGTIRDNNTGLTWMRCSLGHIWSGSDCNGSATSYTWSEALAAANKSNFADFNDWYLPNIKELSSIIEVACYNPSINDKMFPNTVTSGYWTSTSLVTSSYNVSSIYFYSGMYSANSKGDRLFVRLVRVEK